MAIEQIFTVEGMTCDHCAQTVTRAVTEVPGVEDVRVDLPTGTVTVSGSADVAPDEVRAVIEKAGFSA